jgi:excisionase family DNA binding protein
MEQQQFYTVRQAAKLLQISPVTMHRRITEGKITFFRTNGDTGDIRISREAIDAFIQANSQVAAEVK